MSTRLGMTARRCVLQSLTVGIATVLIGSLPADALPRSEYPTRVEQASVSPEGPSRTSARRVKAGRSVGFSPGFELMYASDADLRRELTGMRKLGVRRLRIDVSWALTEPSRGQFDWSVTDRVVREARAAGLRVMGILCYQPDWAETGTSFVNNGGFAAFAGAAARRYAGAVSAWEIWNEPNLERFWSPKPDPVAYARLVEATAQQIRVNAPKAKVVVGALSPAVDAADGSEMSPETFLRAFYNAVSSRSLFDAVSVHPYSYPAMPDGDEEWNTFHRLPQMHELMRSYGDGRKRLWLTEYGAPTGSSDRSVSPSLQAAMMVQAVRQARRNKYVGPIFLYSFRDRAVAPEDPESNFGVVQYDWRPKAAYRALHRALRAG